MRHFPRLPKTMNFPRRDLHSGGTASKYGTGLTKPAPTRLIPATLFGEVLDLLGNLEEVHPFEV